MNLVGPSIFFATIDDLIVHKIFAGRRRDVGDGRTLVLKNPDFDVEYVKHC